MYRNLSDQNSSRSRHFDRVADVHHLAFVVRDLVPAVEIVQVPPRDARWRQSRPLRAELEELPAMLMPQSVSPAGDMRRRDPDLDGIAQKGREHPREWPTVLGYV